MGFENAASGGTSYIGVAVSYNPGGTIITDPTSAPTAVGSASGGTLPAGSYKYKVTFVGGTPAGETTPTAASTAYVASGSTSSVALSVIPTGGTGTTDRNIYRSTDATNYYLLKTLSGNIATTYTDTGADTLTGILAPTSNTTNIGKAGLAPAPVQFVPVTENNLTADWDMAEPKVMRGTDLTDAVMVPTKLDPMGDLTWLFNSTLGPTWFMGALGGMKSLDAVTTTSTGPVVTDNGISTIPVTGNFVQGAQVDVGTGSTIERRTVAGYTATTGPLQVYALTANANAPTGLAVKQVAQDQYARSVLDSSLRKRIPLYCIEDAAGGGDWSWAFRDMAVDGLDFSFGEKEITVKTAFVGSAEPLYYTESGKIPGTNTDADGATADYNPNSGDEAIALDPMTSINAYLLAGGDPEARGSSSFRAALGAEKVTINYKNAFEKKSVFNASNAYLYLQSGNASCEISYDEIVTSLRPDVWQDYIKLSNAVPFIMGAWKNYGTASTPTFAGISVCVPSMKFKKSPRQKKVGAADLWSRSGKALAPPGVDDYLQIFVANIPA